MVRQFVNTKDNSHTSVKGCPTIHLRHFLRNSQDGKKVHTLQIKSLQKQFPNSKLHTEAVCPVFSGRCHLYFSFKKWKPLFLCSI